MAFRQLAAGQLPSEPVFSLVLTSDCLHDMPRPDEAARGHPPVREACMKAGGAPVALSA